MPASISQKEDSAMFVLAEWEVGSQKVRRTLTLENNLPSSLKVMTQVSFPDVTCPIAYMVFQRKIKYKKT